MDVQNWEADETNDSTDPFVDATPLPNASPDKKTPRNTKAEASRLYESWQTLIPKLVEPLLAYLQKSSGKPMATTLQIPCCLTCQEKHRKVTRILCLYWDRA